MADSHFKRHKITFPFGWKTHTSGTTVGNYKYKPDRSFIDDSGSVVCVAESSSTNDRKTGLGELCLADKFFYDNNRCGVLIFSLCGNSAYPPKPLSQANYIEPYFRHLKLCSGTKGVSEMYFIDEAIFEQLRWYALDEKFLSAAVAIKA